MKDYKLIFFLGVIVLITPVLGIPEIFKVWIITIDAIILIIYSLYTRSIFKKQNRNHAESVFVESSRDQAEIEIKPEILEEAEEIEEKLMSESNE